MNKADEALADVRRWLCDNLGDGDAGKVCGMLSVVSRRIAEIEEENAKLRKQVRKLVPELCEQNAALCKENAKLRELACHLWYVKPRDVTSVLVDGRLVDLEDLMEGVGLRWEDA